LSVYAVVMLTTDHHEIMKVINKHHIIWLRSLFLKVWKLASDIKITSNTI